MTIENTEEEEGDEDHHEKVTDENVVATVAEILSQFCWTNCQNTITFCKVCLVTKDHF